MHSSGSAEDPPRSLADLEERLSRPTAAVLDTLRQVPGDTIVLGAAGKMGPSLTRMLRRAAKMLDDSRRIIAVSRFGSAGAEDALRDHGIETIPADLADRSALAALPDAANIVFMAGQKFGTTDAPAQTWGTNAVVPGMVAERYRDARIVAFSTGNVYPLVPVASGGATERTLPAPVGEYAISCLARERILEFFSARHGTRIAIVRLNYAVDLRYGVLVDIARRVRSGGPVDLRMGHVNAIWQGDANAQAICALAIADSPPRVVNVTGAETLSVRAVAGRFAERFGCAAQLTGIEAPDALLSDASQARALFGPPSVQAERLIDWVGDWVSRDAPLLDKPTHFEARDGRY